MTTNCIDSNLQHTVFNWYKKLSLETQTFDVKYCGLLSSVHPQVIIPNVLNVKINLNLLRYFLEGFHRGYLEFKGFEWGKHLSCLPKPDHVFFFSALFNDFKKLFGLHKQLQNPSTGTNLKAFGMIKKIWRVRQMKIIQLGQHWRNTRF